MKKVLLQIILIAHLFLFVFEVIICNYKGHVNTSGNAPFKV